MLGFDLTILNFIQSHLKTAFGDIIMPMVSALGNKGFIWIILSLTLCVFPKYRKIGLTMITALLLNVLLCNIVLKPLVARIRPFNVNTDIELLISAPKDFSFPSGHTSVSFSAAAALLFGKCRLWIPSMILASLIAFSRLYLYVHYPTDVFAGILLGFFIGYISNLISRYAEKRFRRPKPQ